VPALWLRHDSSLAHDIPGHPERPERIRALEAEMERNDWFGAALLEAPVVDRELLRTVHPGRYVTALEEFCARGGGFLDADTAAVESTFEAAMRAAGGAVALVDGLLGGTARVGVSALRPPGHHAEPSRAMGFCFFGNVAVAARRAVTTHGLSRVLILDWDVHHGNGTEAIFAADPDVLFVSIHEWPLYPGTGPASYVGEGAGKGFTVNLPVPGGSGDSVYRSLVADVVLPLVFSWEPQLVLVSAGFDAHHADPLASCTVTEAGFAGMTGSLRAACDALGVPLGLVLEGGYDLGALAGSMAVLMPVLVDEATPDPGVVERHPLADDARRRLEPYWPGLPTASAPG
jgi:acetoin utilization deacetylase AcuC-like enzyme